MFILLVYFRDIKSKPFLIKHCWNYVIPSTFPSMYGTLPSICPLPSTWITLPKYHSSYRESRKWFFFIFTVLKIRVAIEVWSWFVVVVIYEERSKMVCEQEEFSSFVLWRHFLYWEEGMNYLIKFPPSSPSDYLFWRLC